ncbi:MAG TPA: pitrilysin family protein [Longimicrobiales bacterium]
MTFRSLIRSMIAAGLALGLVAGNAAAQGVPPIEFSEFTLPNGLRVIVHEDHSTPLVAVNVWYDVGAAHEEPGRSGFAHLFEHMLFQETENLEAGEILRLIPAAGGTFNGTTNSDRTNYFEILPANRLNLALWTHRERMAKLRVNAENFAREREVVKEERRRSYENAPYAEAVAVTLDTLLNDWPPYDHPVIGSMADLDAATVDDVRAFYERYYVPNNATMVIAGDVTVGEVRKLVEQYFGDIPRGPEMPPLPTPTPTPRTDGERRITVEDKLATLPLIAMGFNIPPHDHPDTYALQLLSSIFSQGESSRLHQRLVKEERAALQVVSFLNSRQGPGSFLFYALPNQGVGLERLEALIAEEIEKLTRDGVTERELQKAKNQLRADQIMGRQTVFAKTEALQHYRRYHGDPAEVNRDLDRYMAVTADDIRAVARKYLTEANRTVMTVVPQQRAAGTDAAPTSASGAE